MKALRFHASIPRYITTKLLGKITKSAYLSFFPPTKLDDIPEPVVRKDWVKIETKFAGICGSDVNTILLQESPLLEPLCSFPAVLGHENVGIVKEIGSNVKNVNIGDRVVIDPILSCIPRGIKPVCQNCEKGDTVCCENFDRGNLSPAFDIGWCRDTGGTFSQYYLAHGSQIHTVPDNVTDENAVLVEPFSIGIHAVLQHFPKDNETVIVIGTGVIGLMVIIALRSLGSKAKIIAIDKREYQGKLALEKAGANSFICVKKGYYQEFAKHFKARIYKPILEKKELIVGGGADMVFECVGIPSTIEDALRFTKSGGKMILIGNPHQINVDWSLIWFRELKVIGSFGSTLEREDDKAHAFDIALELMSSGEVDVSWMITHKFDFPKNYKRGIKYSMNKERFRVIKAIFSFTY
ncbi:MAG: alcohol dehydrogenase catalytic domain-containing protein [Candidatus Heimdallarchaeota archaeon]|nr:MAG: alcohol dehydrogenase catalytic domain-containing protein [Candidatus Heimdallarchaeota archaeon]